MTGRLLLALALAVPLTAQDLRPQDTIPLDPAVRTGRLSNGMRYFIRPNVRPEDRAELRLAVNVGSILEQDDERGVAHFVEHMAFNGTARFPKHAIVDYLETVGMRFGADVNAYTNFDETVYMLQVPTDSAILSTGITILADWASAVSFEDEEVARERGVVLEEWRGGRGAGARIRDAQFPIVFRGSRYADRIPIGTRESLESLPPATLREFYGRWYRPELMTVIAVGDFDPDVVEQLIRDAFGPISPRPGPTREPAAVPASDSLLVSIVTDPEATSSSVTLLIKQPTTATLTAADYRSNLVRRLTSAMLSARLFERSQSANPPFLGAGAGYGSLTRTRDVFSVGAGVTDSGLSVGLTAMATELERASRHGFTAPELERESARILRSVQLGYDERDKAPSGGHAGALVSHALQGGPVPDPAISLALTQRLLPTIALSETDSTLRLWTASGDRVVLVGAPDRPPVRLPDEAEIRAILRDAAGQSVAAYQSDSVDARLVPQPPVAGQIVAEEAMAETGITIWYLSNGAVVFLKPTDFRDDQVMFRAYSPGGTSRASDGDLISASLATGIVSTSGAGALDPVGFRRAMAGRAAFVAPSVSETSEGMVGQASPHDLETLFQLAWLRMTAPRHDTVAYAAYQARVATSLANRTASPEAAFSDTLTVTLTQHHPREMPLTTAGLGHLDLDQALAFYRDRFGDAGDFAFFVVGAFQPDSIRPLVELYLASLPGSEREDRWQNHGVRPPDGVVERIVRRGSEPKARTQIMFRGPYDDGRETRLAISALGDALDMRLRDIVREDLGGTYGVRVSAGYAIAPDTSFTIAIGFGADPDRLDGLVDTLFGELRLLQEFGPDSAVVERIRETMRRERETNLESNAWWIGQFVAAYRWGLELANVGDETSFEEGLNQLTPAFIQAAARRYLTLNHYVRVTLMPEVVVP